MTDAGSAPPHPQGKVLTNGIKAIHIDFQAAVERFQVSAKK